MGNSINCKGEMNPVEQSNERHGNVGLAQFFHTVSPHSLIYKTIESHDFV